MVRAKSVDAWVETVRATADNWPPNRPYLELHDMREIVVSPYAQAKGTELVRSMEGVQGRGAILINESLTGTILRTFINHIFSPFNRTLKRRVFTSYDEALEWLREERKRLNAGY